MQVEDVGEPVRDDGKRVACCVIAVRDRGVVQPDGRIIERRGADVHAGPAARQTRRRIARVLAGFVCEFEQEPLLRIHLLRLARGQAKDGGIEAPDVRQNPGRPGIAPARLLEAGMAMARERPAIGRDRRDRAAAAVEQIPQRRDGLRPRKPARATDHRDMQIVNCETTSQGLNPHHQPRASLGSISACFSCALARRAVKRATPQGGELGLSGFTSRGKAESPATRSANKNAARRSGRRETPARGARPPRVFGRNQIAILNDFDT